MYTYQDAVRYSRWLTHARHDHRDLVHDAWLSYFEKTGKDLFAETFIFKGVQWKFYDSLKRMRYNYGKSTYHLTEFSEDVTFEDNPVMSMRDSRKVYNNFDADDVFQEVVEQDIRAFLDKIEIETKNKQGCHQAVMCLETGIIFDSIRKATTMFPDLGHSTARKGIKDSAEKGVPFLDYHFEMVNLHKNRTKRFIQLCQEGYSHAEIAKDLNVSEAWLSKFRAKLKTAIKQMISNPIRTSTLKIVTKMSEQTWEKRKDHDDFELDDYNEFYKIYKHKESHEGWLVKLKEEKINPYIK